MSEFFKWTLSLMFLHFSSLLWCPDCFLNFATETTLMNLHSTKYVNGTTMKIIFNCVLQSEKSLRYISLYPKIPFFWDNFAHATVSLWSCIRHFCWLKITECWEHVCLDRQRTFHISPPLWLDHPLHKQLCSLKGWSFQTSSHWILWV